MRGKRGLRSIRNSNGSRKHQIFRTYKILIEIVVRNAILFMKVLTTLCEIKGGVKCIRTLKKKCHNYTCSLVEKMLKLDHD